MKQSFFRKFPGNLQPAQIHFRKLFAAILFTATCMGSFAQGTIIFNNRNLAHPVTGEDYNAPVTLPGGGGASGNLFTAGLFLVEGNELTLIATTHFREGVAAGYFLPVVSPVEVPGIPTGSPATFRARVWETAAGSYDAAVRMQRWHGEFQTHLPENNIFIEHLGPAPGHLRQPDLSGIQPLMLIPEPSTTALLLLGIVAVATLRRR